MPLLVLFVVIPLLEIYLLLKVGGLIGVLPTILVVIGTALLGTWLLKQQGMATFHRYQQNISQGKIPAQEMVEGLALVFGGALLLTPGFFTDAVGFLCLIPVTRQAVIRGILKRVRFSSFSASSSTYTGEASARPTRGVGRTIDADYSVKDRED